MSTGSRLRSNNYIERHGRSQLDAKLDCIRDGSGVFLRTDTED
jgi:hypothetical protein